MRLEGGIQNGINVTMKINHDVTIATPRADGEVDVVIGVQLADRPSIDVDLAGQDAGEEGSGAFSRRYFGGGIIVGLGFSGA